MLQSHVVHVSVRSAEWIMLRFIYVLLAADDDDVMTMMMMMTMTMTMTATNLTWRRRCDVNTDDDSSDCT